MKVAVIGGGSTYTPELIQGFLERTEDFPLTELWLMDIDAERLAVVGSFAQRIAAARNAPFRVHLTTDRREALRGTAYVITQLRVGQMEARRADEYLGRRHGLVGQETTGVGGMAKALRTVPVILQIARDLLELGDHSFGLPLLANFTNPSGLVTQALSQMIPELTSVGVCNAPITTKMGLLEGWNRITGQKVTPERAELDTLGLNHLSWHRGLKIDGEDVWNQVLQGYVYELKTESEPEWEPRLIEILRMIPNYYLQYYYHTAHKLEAQMQWPPSRADEVIEVEKDLLREYADPELNQPPADLMKRGGAYYSTVATQLLNAHFNDLGETHVVNTRHGGAVHGWDPDWVLEMPCRVDRRGIHPLPAEPLPPVCFGLLAQIKAYELLTVQAAVHGDRNALYEALLVHPLGPQADQVQVVMDDLLETNRRFLPQFFGGAA